MKQNLRQFALFIVALLTGSALGAFASAVIMFNFTNLTIGPDSAISMANTYIFFISIIFILFTIGLTIFGFYFSKWFTTEKMKEVHQTIVIIGRQLRNSDETRELFIEEIFRDEQIKNDIIAKVKKLLEEDKEFRSEEDLLSRELGF